MISVIYCNSPSTLIISFIIVAQFMRERNVKVVFMNLYVRIGLIISFVWDITKNFEIDAVTENKAKRFYCCRKGSNRGYKQVRPKISSYFEDLIGLKRRQINITIMPYLEASVLLNIYTVNSTVFSIDSRPLFNPIFSPQTRRTIWMLIKSIWSIIEKIVFWKTFRPKNWLII